MRSTESKYRRAKYCLAILWLMLVLPLHAQATSMCFGVGSRFLWPLDATHHKTTPQLLRWLGFSPNNRLLGIWLPPDWQPEWIAGLQGAMDEGYIPVLFDYSYGDLYRYGKANAWRYVETHRKNFYADISRLVHVLQPLRGTVLVVLQPEFNVPGVQNHPAFGRMLAKAAERLHDTAHPGLRILVGTCVGDFGHYGTWLSDQREWARFAPVLKPAMPYLNFLAFQEMRGGTHLNAQGEMHSYTPAQEGISVLGLRTAAFSAYLHTKWRKPLLLAYFEISTLTPPNQPPGTWEKAAEQGYTELFRVLPELERNGVFGIMSMSLFDNEASNNDGQSFWGNASDYFGLVAANAPLGQDLIGYPPYTIKPSGRVWLDDTNKLTEQCPDCAALLHCGNIRN